MSVSIIVKDHFTSMFRSGLFSVYQKLNLQTTHDLAQTRAKRDVQPIRAAA